MKIKLSEEERQTLWAACTVLYDAMDRAVVNGKNDEAEAINKIAHDLRALYNGSNEASK